MTTSEKITAIRETLAGALDAESDFRRIGATTLAHEMALMATTCREQLARLALIPTSSEA